MWISRPRYQQTRQLTWTVRSKFKYNWVFPDNWCCWSGLVASFHREFKKGNHYPYAIEKVKIQSLEIGPAYTQKITRSKLSESLMLVGIDDQKEKGNEEEVTAESLHAYLQALRAVMNTMCLAGCFKHRDTDDAGTLFSDLTQSTRHVAQAEHFAMK